MNTGVWINKTKIIKGAWEYYRPSDRFDIWLDSKDRITGRSRTVQAYGDKPEFNNYKLVSRYITTSTIRFPMFFTGYEYKVKKKAE